MRGLSRWRRRLFAVSLVTASGALGSVAHADGPEAPSPEQPIAPPPPAPSPVTVTAEPQFRLRGIPITTGSSGWGLSFYGFAELDGMVDSTRSFTEGVVNNTLARPDTYAGDNPRVQGTVRNSRLGFDMRAPDFGDLKMAANVEMDFFGSQASASEGDLYTNSVLRLRHFYVKVATPAVDVLAGQYHDLYGWGGAGFFPNTIAFLPLLGEIYHRNPQLRLSKRFGGPGATLEVAVAAVRPAQRDSAMPDGEAGILFQLHDFRGASAPGASRPQSAPFGVGISAVGRRFSVTDFAVNPGNEHAVYGGGVAANLFLPIIPAHGADKEDLSNSISLTLEGSMETGAADLYPGLTGGILFPSLPNPQSAIPVPVYSANVDAGLVTYDAYDTLRTINWSSALANLQYHLPFGAGKRVWISATGSLIHSTNSVEVTPLAGRSQVWNSGNYLDATLWLSPAPPLLIGLGGQTEAQTFGDNVVARNYRGEVSCYFFF
jgi:hypothetical protein